MNIAELRAKVLATSNPKPFPLTIAGWEGVHVKPLLVGEIEGMKTVADPKMAAAFGIARMLCNADGELIFDASNPDDLIGINGLRAATLQSIQAAMAEVNPGSVEAIKELGNG